MTARHAYDALKAQCDINAATAVRRPRGQPHAVIMLAGQEKTTDAANGGTRKDVVNIMLDVSNVPDAPPKES